MTLPFAKRPIKYIYVGLLIILFIAAPLAFIVITILLGSYGYMAGQKRMNGQMIQTIYGGNRTLLIFACLLTLASLAITQTSGYVTQLGFPTTIVTYYVYPEIAESNRTWFGILTTSLLINLLPAGINIASYFLLLRIIQKLWRGNN